MIARCRVLLASEIFSIPPLGTFVMHPVTTPELTWLFLGTEQPGSRACRPYALADRRGVDTGPVFGYFTHPYDERHESHEVIQKRMILENLDALRERFLAIERGEARATHPAAHQPRGVNRG